MKQVSTFEEFIKINTNDVPKIIQSKFRWALVQHRIEADDLAHAFYVHMARTDLCAKYDSTKGASFSTWIFTCLSNFIKIYEARVEVSKAASSLDVLIGDESGMTRLDALAGEEFDLDTLFMDDEIRAALAKQNSPTTALWLKVYDGIRLGYSDTDMAEQMGYSKAYVNRAHLDMVKHLKRVMNEEN